MAREWRVCNLKWRSPSAPLHNPKMKHTRLTSEENGQVRLGTLRTGSHGWPTHYSLTPSCMRSARPAEILHCPEFDRNIEDCLAVLEPHMTEMLSQYTNSLPEITPRADMAKLPI